MNENNVKDCSTCKHGKWNDHWENYFCYNPNLCNNWKLWEEDEDEQKN